MNCTRNINSQKYVNINVFSRGMGHGTGQKRKRKGKREKTIKRTGQRGFSYLDLKVYQPQKTAGQGGDVIGISDTWH